MPPPRTGGVQSSSRLLCLSPCPLVTIFMLMCRRWSFCASSHMTGIPPGAGAFETRVYSGRLPGMRTPPPFGLGSHLAAGRSCIPGVSDCLFANSRVPHTIFRSLHSLHAQFIPVMLRTGLRCLVCICPPSWAWDNRRDGAQKKTCHSSVEALQKHNSPLY